MRKYRFFFVTSILRYRSEPEWSVKNSIEIDHPLKWLSDMKRFHHRHHPGADRRLLWWAELPKMTKGEATALERSIGTYSPEDLSEIGGQPPPPTELLKWLSET